MLISGTPLRHTPLHVHRYAQRAVNPTWTIDKDEHNTCCDLNFPRAAVRRRCPSRECSGVQSTPNSSSVSDSSWHLTSRYPGGGGGREDRGGRRGCTHFLLATCIQPLTTPPSRRSTVATPNGDTCHIVEVSKVFRALHQNASSTFTPSQLRRVSTPSISF